MLLQRQSLRTPKRKESDILEDMLELRDVMQEGSKCGCVPSAQIATRRPCVLFKIQFVVHLQ